MLIATLRADRLADRPLALVIVVVELSIGSTTASRVIILKASSSISQLAHVSFCPALVTYHFSSGGQIQCTWRFRERSSNQSAAAAPDSLNQPDTVPRL